MYSDARDKSKLVSDSMNITASKYLIQLTYFPSTTMDILYRLSICSSMSSCDIFTSTIMFLIRSSGNCLRRNFE
jgi:hypothetical protein